MTQYPQPLAPFSSCRALVIDDDETNVTLYSRLLKKAGLVSVATTTDPLQALTRVHALDPDIILLDLHMPQMSGLQVLDRLAVQAGGSYRPVIVLTGDGSREAVQEALEHGAADFVTKPVDPTELLLRVGNLLRTRMLYETLRRHNVELREQLGSYPRAARPDEPVSVTRERVQAVIDSSGLEIALQPVIDLTTRKAVGYEALARFPSRARATSTWFGDARAVGLGVQLEVVALRAALLLRQGMDGLGYLAVNASPEVLLSGYLPELIAPPLCPHVVVELTETTPVGDYAAVQRVMSPLREIGLRLAVDDAGSGYAGFRHLLDVSPDIVKLDLSLIRGIENDPTRRALTAALVSFTKDVGVELVAEGVETDTELAVLEDLGVTRVQGFLFARPEPAHETLARWG